MRPICLFLLAGMLLSTPVNAQFVYPIGNPNIRPTGTDSSLAGNGYKVTQYFNNPAGHTGVDLANGLEGGEVRSIAFGTVVKVQLDPTSTTGWGNLVRIQHDIPGIGTIYSQYAHLMNSSIAVSEGQSVSAGTPLGAVDCSGYTLGTAVCPSNQRTGPHVHFSIQLMNRNACGYLPDARCPNDTFDLYLNIDPLQFIADRRANNFQPPTFLSFIEGNPGVPGDGRLVNGQISGHAFYTLSAPISMGTMADGFTLTVFPGTPQNLVQIQFNLTAGSICLNSSTGSVFGGHGNTILNGVRGTFINVTKSHLDLLVDSFGTSSSCTRRLTLDDVRLFLIGVSAGNPPTPVATLDAAAIGSGQDNFPGSRIP